MNLGIENETLEFKKTTSEVKQAIISMSAMLNKHKVGTIYFGVNSKGEVLGQDVSEETLRSISQTISEKLKPQIYPTIEKINVENKTIVKIEINGDDIPYSAYGRYYMRTADEDREITPDELKKMMKGDVDSDSFETKKSEDKITDIDDSTVRKFIEDAVASKRLPSDKSDNITIVKKLGLVNEDYLNNAGRILFSKNNPVAVKMAVFATNEKLTFIDQKIVENNIINLLDITEAYIFEHTNWKVEITSGPRKEIPEIPVSCIRELLSNFFAHSIYYGRTYHEINIHPGFISIYNPGTFASVYRPEDYADGIKKSYIRNKLIAKTLYLYNRIEQFGSGLNRVITLLNDNNVKFKFENSSSGFNVFLYRKNNTFIEDNSKLELTKIEEIVLQIIKNNSRITTTDISIEISKTRRSVMNIIKKLTDKGALERVGSRKTGYWKVNI